MSMERIALGIDLGGTTVKIGLVKDSGQFLDTWEIPTDTSERGKNILPDIFHSAEEKLSEHRLSMDLLAGIGIGVPGAVLQTGEVNRCVNLGWNRFHLVDAMHAMFGALPIAAANDANVAALGEAWVGSGSGYSSVVMVTLGTGVGGGIVIHGKLLDGYYGAAGEIGHILINPDEKEHCNCGKCGCLEQYCAAPGMVRTARHFLEAYPEQTLLNHAELSAKSIFDAAREGDFAAGQIVQIICERLGRALSIIAAVADPEIFLIGGGVSRAGDALLVPLRAEYEKYAFHAQKETKINTALLGNRAGMLGAAKLVLS